MWLENLGGIDSTFAEGIVMFNSATQPMNFYRIEPIPPAFSLMHDTVNLSSCAVAYDQGTYRTVGTIFELGSLEDGEHPSTKRELLLRILNFFEVDYSLTGVDESAVSSQQSAVRVFPNPTSGSTQFAVRSSRSEHVIIKIYDLHGREVATVADQQLPTGEHVIGFDASRLPAGVYIWRQSLVVSRQSSVGKLIKY
jgi:hypothetical protein